MSAKEYPVTPEQASILVALLRDVADAERHLERMRKQYHLAVSFFMAGQGVRDFQVLAFDEQARVVTVLLPDILPREANETSPGERNSRLAWVDGTATATEAADRGTI